MQNLDHVGSYYAASGLPQPPRPALRGTVDADIAIVGAGYTGLNAGLALARRGYRVVVLEAARVGWGASGRNGGQIVHSYSRDIDTIAASHGREVAAPLGAMAFDGAAVLRRNVREFGIDCHLQDGGIFAALTDKQVAKLEHHKALWEGLGHPGLEIVRGARARDLVQTERYRALLVDPTGGHFHPLRLAQGEAAGLESLGGVIHEHSRVQRIERGSTAVVHTDQGQVRAKFVLVACNAYVGNLEPQLLARSMPCGTQVVATEPLGERGRALLPHNHCVEDCNYLLDYFRLSADGRLVYGGGVTYGAPEITEIRQVILPKLLKTFPQLEGVRIDYAWSGNFQLTLSRLPDVGRLAGNIYYSHGCSGHGVTFTYLIGDVLAEAIDGQAGRFDAFARLPHYPFPGGRMFRVPLTSLGAWYYQLRDRLGF
ncbi:NAD(P)/FAD-dependent oxidoreductase [Roseateles saccharophilus]|uniref:Gamma-glutamylputrescine oxidase n=1 Tax=Roseateles saccharophilus TaxID=304 RepID=A0A4R3VKZ0_ROSSA|nr:FAD-binding oxidoreductase [Roseateles saccharophilus]MDG0832906.1 FAD-binding oxidoreductase [Roseateles saccharophilus]TCV04578.1 gamma-glutamylputrescine oxidase [Roseateles saccharophilus]